MQMQRSKSRSKHATRDIKQPQQKACRRCTHRQAQTHPMEKHTARSARGLFFPFSWLMVNVAISEYTYGLS